MKILIIGGTSFIGPCVIRELLRDSHELTVFSRGQTQCPLPESVTHLIGDRRTLKNHRDTLRQCRPDVVIDTMILTENDAADCCEVFRGSAKRLVMISSQDVYRAYGIINGSESGDIDNRPITEDAPLRSTPYPYRQPDTDPSSPLYHYDKIPAERAVLATPDLEGVVLRLPMVYGPGDRQHRCQGFLRQMAQAQPVISLDEAEAHWRGARGYVEDIAHAIAMTAVMPSLPNRIYNVAETEAFSTAEWIRMLGDAFGWQGQVTLTPPPPGTSVSPDSIQHLIVSSDRIRRDLGYTEPTDRSERLKRTIEWELL